MPRYYLDLRKHRDGHAKGETPWTPAIAVVYQVAEGVRLMEAEGAENVFARHAACAAAALAGVAAIGFRPFADPAFASKTVTAAWLPDGAEWKAFNAGLKRHGVIVAGGQDRLSGRIFRLGHLGAVTVEEILGAVSAIETVGLELGLDVTPGAGVGAAEAAAIEVLGLARHPAPA
jgi:aspartate aminotransferase-like enzyme